jgi:CDP-ribitol ribitolphosphotransferase
MTHDGSKDGNVGALAEYLKQKKEGYSFFYLRKSERNRVRDGKAGPGRLAFFFVKPYHLATSGIVLLDNVFLPMAYLRFSKKVRVIQLWHGTGTIKKFGQDVNTGRLKKLEKKANSRITHLIVNSEKTKKLYAQTFGISEDRVFVFGLPRTDLFFDSGRRNERIRRFYEQYPQLSGKKLILYAPTFRDQECRRPEIKLDTRIWNKEMPADTVLLLRVHPFVAEAFEKDREQYTGGNQQNILSVSSYPDINTLLLVSDCLITDYSSVIFEYCLLKRPMIFYAYDLEQFSDSGRGFYEDYEEYVPGPAARDTKTLINLLKKGQPDGGRTEAFIKEMSGADKFQLIMVIFHIIILFHEIKNKLKGLDDIEGLL